MPLKPTVGSPGGQRYDVAKAIRTFLEQMAGGAGFSFGGAVIKELIQNADDAGASELVVALDERKGEDLPAECSEYSPLLEPGLLVRNDAPFRVIGEVPGDQDDFTAICEVAGGHKRFNPTAAGRFGIGFNSVYFLTDTPVIFSRREVHIFDLRRLMFAEDGWRFSLDDFPAAASSVGPIKTVLEWVLPKAVVGESSFPELASQGRDYKQTIFRLPLRQTLSGGSGEQRGPVFPSASFPKETDRRELLREMCEEARRSLLFLKSLRRVTFGRIVERRFDEWACVEATRRPSTGLALEKFVKDVRGMKDKPEQARRVECSFTCDVSLRVNSEQFQVLPRSAAFQVTHVADFTNPNLRALTEKLLRNQERAVPWVAIAAPLDARGFDWEGAGNARWRVFLPLAEEGPSASILNAAVFVDPSRRAIEFRTDGSDETLRKSQWNRTLVEQLLTPLLREASTMVIDNAPELIQQEPKKYLSLFPAAASTGAAPACLTDVVRGSFCSDLWLLKLYDIWKAPFDVWMGPEGPELQLEKVPEWLLRYKGAFQVLTTESRRFVGWNVGDAVGERLAEGGNVDVKRPGMDVADRVLLADQPPQPKDLQPLLKLLSEESLNTADLQRRWTFQRDGGDESLLRFDADYLYLVRTEQTPAVYGTLGAIGISFEKAEWVAPDVGLCALPPGQIKDITNVVDADDRGAIELLRRIGPENRQDLLSAPFEFLPIVDFLCSQSALRLTEDLRLAFMVKTAPGKLDRRNLGVLFLRPEFPTPDEVDMWEGLLRQTFAEVDPQFTPHLRRLLAHAPQLLTCLASGGCEVRLAKGDLLDLLHDVRTREAGFVGRLVKQLNQQSDDSGDRRSRVYRAARLLILEADRRWESIEQPLRNSVLALPIHRTADGDMISLLPEGEISPDQFSDRFFLQSENDLRDAPFEPRGGQLLHSLDPDLRGFYRHRLQIRERGRVEVLKECLRQIGTDTNRSGGILKYVARYYLDSVEQLRERGGEGADDLRELEELHGAARGIPCLDGNWRSADECIDATPLRPLLETQGWTGKRLDELLCRLSYPRPVAEVSSNAAKLARSLWEVEELDRDVLAELAITSESPDLPFADRVRVIADNLKLVSEMPPARAFATTAEILESLGGPIELGSLALVDPDEIRLGDDVIRAVMPEATDLRRLAARFTDGRVPVFAEVLRALSVPIVDGAGFRSRTVADFAAIWARLDNRARIALLAWLGGKDAALPGDAPKLDTVFVGEGDGKWVSPAAVIAPSWASPTPPNLPANSVARTADIPQPVLRLWDRWCGLRDLEAVVGCVVHKTCELPREQWPAAARRLVRWLEEIAGQRSADAVAVVLRDLPWVLARKGGELAFKPPKEVLDHPGAEVLRHEFWVVVEKIPTLLARSVQTRQLEGTRDDLEAIARCLASGASAPPAAAQSVYQLLVEWMSDEQGTGVWHAVATSKSVYRLFRSGEHGPDRVVSCEELFLGDQELKEDFGQVLFCFGTTDERRKNVRQLYRKLGLDIRPSTRQLVGALSRIPGDSHSSEVHGALVDTLTGSPPDELENLREVDLSCIKVRSCAKAYEPLSRCYRDPELDRPSRLSAECRERLIDTRDSANRKLTRWLDEAFPGLVLELRSVATAELTHEPEESHGPAANVLDAWRDWLAELATMGSVVRDDVEKLGFALPSGPVRLYVVPKVHVRFCLVDGSFVVPSDEWVGLELFHDSSDRIFVRHDLVERDFVGQAGDVESLDARIVGTLEDLLRKHGSPAAASPPVGALSAAVRETLERPGTVLKRMKEEKQEHFFHQYLDQTADPEFSHLFDAYRRTSTSATEKRRRMAEDMWNLISLRFVDARRIQIRGYGYDEFAIFAELVQNAEDAYSQREHLGLPEPAGRGVTFTYSVADGGRNLAVSHYGRPFNLWRYGSRRVDSFRYDVEGVLKSAGSFKPHSMADGARPIGRFGLGFKSVYLVTDAPRIHSGDWHFEITAGCIPNEIAVPDDYEKEQTRVVLPLTAGAREERDGERGRYANLLPFLRQIDVVRIEHSDGISLELQRTSRTVLPTREGYRVDRVEIAGATHVPGGVIRLLRVRHEDHEGQLSLLLGGDGLPVAWSDAFESDVFAVLPLRVRLGCGIGVSNLFEVQSGRTHLIDPTANAPRVVEVAQSLPAVVKALVADDGAKAGEVMSRFWSIWRWDRGDEEASDLRRALARELVQLTRSASVIPTLDPEKCVKLGAGVLFSFENLPEELAGKLVEKVIELAVEGRRVRVEKSNVVPVPTRIAVERVYSAAGEKGGIAVARVGWPELAEEFQAETWLAEHPDLVSAMARSLPPDGMEQVRPWLGKCVFKSASGKNETLTDLLPSRFPGRHLLPQRFLNLLHDDYDEAAVGLLKHVGLPSRPPLETMKSWLRSGFDGNECNNLLRFLSEAGRWRREYYDLGSSLTAPWFDANGERITTAEAFVRKLVTLEDLDPDPAFRAWLGIETGTIQINLEDVRWDRPVPNPQRALEEIWDWWSNEKDDYVRRYDQQTYPDGEPPRLDRDFSPQDTLQRQNWLSLIMLASWQTMGRANPEQHRNFLRQCARQGWMDVFADPRLPADGWIGVLDDYLGTTTDDMRFYHWIRQFVSTYQIARWLPEYVLSFLAIDKFKKRFDLDQVTRPAMNPDFGGGGPSAPPLTRALGIGACFVVRELVRTGVLKKDLANDHAFVAIGRVRSVLARLGMTDLQDEAASYRQSPQIHRFLLDHLGPDKAHFDRCFDLPFLAIADDPELQQHFLKCQLAPDDEEGA